VDSIEDVYEREWDAYDVDKWAHWMDTDDRVSLPALLERSALSRHYPTLDVIESALCELFTFGHEGLEKYIHTGTKDDGGKAGMKRSRRAMVNSHLCRFYPSRLCISSDGYILRGPTRAQRHDKIVIFAGAKVPWVIRSVEGHHPCFTLVGECCTFHLNNLQAVMGEG